VFEGISVGESEGGSVGEAVVGAAVVGLAVGTAVVGTAVGTAVVGANVGKSLFCATTAEHKRAKVTRVAWRCTWIIMVLRILLLLLLNLCGRCSMLAVRCSMFDVTLGFCGVEMRRLNGENSTLTFDVLVTVQSRLLYLLD
jgi:hypothetical protein